MRLPLARHAGAALRFEPALLNPTSPKYTHMAAVVHNGLDRMVMQSDLRDIYHGVHVVGFSNITTQPSLVVGSDEATAVVAELYLQLSDNKDEQRLIDVLHKYLQTNNYSLGGTDLYTSDGLVERMAAFGKTQNRDFTTQENRNHHIAKFTLQTLTNA